MTAFPTPLKGKILPCWVHGLSQSEVIFIASKPSDSTAAFAAIWLLTHSQKHFSHGHDKLIANALGSHAEKSTQALTEASGQTRHTHKHTHANAEL